MDPLEFDLHFGTLVAQCDFIAYFRAKLRREAEADDLAAETLCRVWQESARFEGAGYAELRRWAFGVAAKVLQEHWRERWIWEDTRGIPEELPDPGSADPPEQVLLRRFAESSPESVGDMEAGWRSFVLVGRRSHDQDHVVDSCIELLKDFVDWKWSPCEFHRLWTMQPGIAPGGRFVLARMRLMSAGDLSLRKSCRATRRTRRGLVELSLGGADRADICRRYGVLSVSPWLTRHGNHLQELNLIRLAQRAWGMGGRVA